MLLYINCLNWSTSELRQDGMFVSSAWVECDMCQSGGSTPRVLRCECQHALVLLGWGGLKSERWLFFHFNELLMQFMKPCQDRNDVIRHEIVLEHILRLILHDILPSLKRNVLPFYRWINLRFESRNPGTRQLLKIWVLRVKWRLGAFKKELKAGLLYKRLTFKLCALTCWKGQKSAWMVLSVGHHDFWKFLYHRHVWSDKIDVSEPDKPQFCYDTSWDWKDSILIKNCRSFIEMRSWWRGLYMRNVCSCGIRAAYAKK